LKYGKRRITFYRNIIQNLNDWKVNKKVREIINNDEISVKIKFKCDENGNGIFNIEEFIGNTIKKNDRSICKTIKEFMEKFPNLIEYETKLNANIFDIQKKLEFPENIDKYIKIITNNLNNRKENSSSCFLLFYRFWLLLFLTMTS
jgi:hypothetical protein